MCNVCRCIIRLLLDTPDEEFLKTTSKNMNKPLSKRVSNARELSPMRQNSFEDSTIKYNSHYLEEYNPLKYPNNDEIKAQVRLRPIRPKSETRESKNAGSTFSRKNEPFGTFLYSKQNRPPSDNAAHNNLLVDTSYKESLNEKANLSFDMYQEKREKNDLNSNIYKNIGVATFGNPKQQKTPFNLFNGDQPSQKDRDQNLKGSNRNYLHFLSENSNQYKPVRVIHDPCFLNNNKTNDTFEDTKLDLKKDIPVKELPNLYTNKRSNDYNELRESLPKMDDKPYIFKGFQAEKHTTNEDQSASFMDVKESNEGISLEEKGSSNQEPESSDIPRTNFRGRPLKINIDYQKEISDKVNTKRPILKSPELRKFSSKEKVYSESKESPIPKEPNLLKVTEISLQDRRVSFASKQITREHIITPKNKGTKVQQSKYTHNIYK